MVIMQYDGSIVGFDIPELALDIDAHTKTSAVPLLEEEVKKILKYPLKMAIFDSEIETIKDRWLEISFSGEKKMPKYSHLLDQLKKKK